MLPNLSYFELRNAFGLGIYASIYPSVDTTPPAPEVLKKLAPTSRVFAKCFVQPKELVAYLTYLKKMRFGTNDFLTCYVPKSCQTATYDVATLCNHLNGLTFKSIGETGKYDTVVTVSSDVFPEPITLRLHRESAPQKAIDTSLVYADVKTGRIATTLGFKKITPSINFTLDDEDCEEVLTTGMYGWLYGSGEHVNATTEGIQVNATVWEYDEILTAGGFVPYKDVEIANRALLEEIGVTVEPDTKKRFFVCGVHDSPGRDPRYWVHKHGTVTYGYERSSASVIILCVVIGSIPTSLPMPTDPAEVEKAKIVPLSTMYKEFQVGGKYPPAFPVHREQFFMTYHKLPEILKSMGVPFSVISKMF
jgi:hypothetical protein